jgi:hypothetical protein
MNSAYKLSDEALDGISGGTELNRYTPEQLRKAGVTVAKDVNGNPIYMTMIGGKQQRINEAAAMGMGDCYACAGGKQLNDQQKRDLIAQS